MTDHAARLASIEARLDAATPGPWEFDETTSIIDAGEVSVAHVHITHDDSGSANADLIAHAPADLRYLLDRVRELEKTVDALELRHMDRDAQDYYEMEMSEGS